jgi:arylformamidase
MKIYDVSLPIHPKLPVWPGDPPIKLVREASIDQGSNANVSRLACGVHIGTHVDAPLHFIEEGASVDQFDLNKLIGRVHVIDLQGVSTITAGLLDSVGITKRARRLFFKTDNSRLWQERRSDFVEDFVAMEVDAAEWVVRRGIQMVGIDYLSIAPFQVSRPTHWTLLGAGVIVVEGLNLWSVPPGRYTVYCLPLNLVGSDGAPARVILLGP